MDILLSTGSLAPRNFRDAASIARRAGLDGLEVMLNRRLLAAGPERSYQVAEEQQVPIRSIHPPIRLSQNAHVTHDDMIASATYARAIPGCRVLVMHVVGGPGLHTERGRAFFSTINEVTDILNGSGVRLAIENRGTVHPQPRLDFLDKLHNLYRVCEEWDLDITFDTSHAASFGLHVVPSLDVVFPRLTNIHLSDRKEEPPAIASGALNALTREHQVPGKGVLPLGHLLERLKAKRYHGAITLELSPVALTSWRENRALERVAQAVSFVREHTMPHINAPDPTHQPRRASAPAETDS